MYLQVFEDGLEKANVDKMKLRKMLHNKRVWNRKFFQQYLFVKFFKQNRCKISGTSKLHFLLPILLFSSDTVQLMSLNRNKFSFFSTVVSKHCSLCYYLVIKVCAISKYIDKSSRLPSTIELLLSAAEGQRPRNYLSCCCWIFPLIYVLSTSTTVQAQNF